MPIEYNGQTVTAIVYNGQNVTSLIYNGQDVPLSKTENPEIMPVEEDNDSTSTDSD